MDFLTNANDFMPVMIAAIPLLSVPSLWAGDQAKYWEELGSKYAGRIHYVWSYGHANRRRNIWNAISFGLFGLLAVVIMYFGFLVMTNVPPALYY